MRPNYEKNKEIAKDLTIWLDNYNRHIVHNSILTYLSEVKESRKEDKLACLLVSERINEETEKMKYTNCIFENITKSLQNEDTIRHLRSVDRGKRSILCRINLGIRGYTTLWLKQPVEQADVNKHNALYSLLSYLNKWVKSEDFSKLSNERQRKILQKFKEEKDKIYGCILRIDWCALYRYVDNYEAAISFLKEIFNDKQELLYESLQSWSDETIKDPEYQSWISFYLEDSKHLEFKNNILLIYVNDVEGAKSFLLSECKKHLESERKEQEEVFKKIENERRKSKRKAMVSDVYIDDYSGSYAQDEMGYSDDEIDTIFDGDPNAYWNID